jgi:hypothetical protein
MVDKIVVCEFSFEEEAITYIRIRTPSCSVVNRNNWKNMVLVYVWTLVPVVGLPARQKCRGTGTRLCK